MFDGIALDEVRHKTYTIIAENPTVHYSVLCKLIDVVVGNVFVNAEFMCSDDFQLDIFPAIDLTELLKKRELTFPERVNIKSNCHAFSFLNSDSLWFCDSFDINEILKNCCTQITRDQQKVGDIILFYQLDNVKNMTFTHSALFSSPNMLIEKPGVYPLHDISLDDILKQNANATPLYYTFRCRPNRV